MPWSSLDSWEPCVVRLGTDDAAALHPETPELAGDELLLWRDVLDTQVVDVRGHRVERVGDLLLTEVGSDEPGPGCALEVAAAEVGASSVARRLHLGALAGRLHEAAIDWADIHLAAGRGHELQLSTTTAAMHTLDGPELAELVARLSTPSATDVLVAVPHERAAAALAASHPAVRHRLAVHLPKPHADAILEHLPPSTAQRLHTARRAHRERGRSHLRWHRHRGWRRTLPPGGGDGTGRNPG